MKNGKLRRLKLKASNHLHIEILRSKISMSYTIMKNLPNKEIEVSFESKETIPRIKDIINQIEGADLMKETITFDKTVKRKKGYGK